MKSPVYGKRSHSNQDSGGYYLCVSCNRLTGSWYGGSYKKFVIGMMALLNRIWASKTVTFEYAIQALNILKQILSMLMAIDSGGELLRLKDLTEFILNKDSQDLPSNIRISMYHTVSKEVRNGWCMINSGGITHYLGEITFPPFGFIYAMDSEPIRDDVF